MGLKPLKASLMVSRVVLKIKNTNFINLYHQTHMNRIWSKYFFMSVGHWVLTNTELLDIAGIWLLSDT